MGGWLASKLAGWLDITVAGYYSGRVLQWVDITVGGYYSGCVLQWVGGLWDRRLKNQVG